MNNATIIAKLVKLATAYDLAGETKKANVIDLHINELLKEAQAMPPAHGNDPDLVEMRGVVSRALTSMGHNALEGDNTIDISTASGGSYRITIERNG